MLNFCDSQHVPETPLRSPPVPHTVLLLDSVHSSVCIYILYVFLKIKSKLLLLTGHL